MLKNLLSNSIVYTFGPQLPRIVGLFLLPFLTPFLSATDFGIWGTLMSFILLFAAARDFGMLAPMVNAFYQHPTRWRWVWRQVASFLFYFGLLFTCIQASVLYLVFPEDGISNREIVIALVSVQSLLFDIPNQLGFRLLQLKERPYLVSLVSVVSGFISLGVQFYVVVFLKLGYLGWFYATFFSTLFSAFAYSVIIYRSEILPFFSFRYRLMRSRIKVSAYMLPHNFSAYLLGPADRMVMSVSRVKMEDVGLYNVAYMWGNYVDIVGNAVGIAVGPAYYKLYSKKSTLAVESIYSLTQLLQIVFVSGLFLLSLWSKELFKIFVNNEDLVGASSLSIFIIMGYSYRPLYWNVINRLQYHYLTDQLWKISLVGGLLNLILNIIFIPIYGYKAAAITTFISLHYLGISGYFLKEFKRLDESSYYHFSWILLILFLTTLLFFLKDLSVFHKCIMSFIVIFFSVFFIYKKGYYIFN